MLTLILTRVGILLLCPASFPPLHGILHSNSLSFKKLLLISLYFGIFLESDPACNYYILYLQVTADCHLWLKTGTFIIFGLLTIGCYLYKLVLFI